MIKEEDTIAIAKAREAKDPNTQTSVQIGFIMPDEIANLILWKWPRNTSQLAAGMKAA
jgi:hypothetical protein